ncbi:lamin tail domain-containing protein [Candidatus Peregrinibacteria bacterium]|nr:lamin tail domain-containing protein [Candidatus Peregrinibacteria bacterium]
MKSFQRIGVRILAAVMLVTSLVPPVSFTESAHAISRNDAVVSAFLADPVDVGDNTGEWMEITNRNDEYINLAGWNLTDGDTHSYRFLPTLLAAQGTLTLCRNGNSRLNGGVMCDIVYGDAFQLKNDGGTIILTDASGKEVNRIEYVSYWVKPGVITALKNLWLNNANFNNWSFIKPSAPAAAVPEATEIATVTLVQGSAEKAGNVLITEFMADPTDVGDESGEWIELYNPTNHTINLQNWILSDEGTEQHVFGALTLSSGKYATLCRNKNYLTNGGVACDYSYGNDIRLKNDGDAIVLKDGHDNLISRVIYSAAWVHPGQSTALKAFVSTAAAANNMNSWKNETQTSIDASGTDMGTPGHSNDKTLEPAGIEVQDIPSYDFPDALPKNSFILGIAGVRVGDMNEPFYTATEVTSHIDSALQNYVQSGQPVLILGWDDTTKTWETVGNETNLAQGRLRVYLAHATTLAFVSPDVLAPYLFEVAQKPTEVKVPVVIAEPTKTPVAEEPVAEPDTTEEETVAALPVAPPVLVAAEQLFKDVNSFFWAYDSIKLLKDLGIVQGYPDGLYRPHRFTNRAEMAKIALRAFDQKPHLGMRAHFKDVSQDAWFSPFVEKARLLGVIQSDKNNYFHPEQIVTKTEALALVLRASRLKLNANYLDAVARDVSASDWSYGYVRFAEEAGIIDAQTKFYPNKPVSRAEVADMTARVLEYAESANEDQFYANYDEMKAASEGMQG